MTACACWAFPSVSTPADVLVLDPAHSARTRARITSVRPSVRGACMCVCVRMTCVHRQSLTFRDLRTEHRPYCTAYISLSLPSSIYHPFPPTLLYLSSSLSFSPSLLLLLSTSMHFVRARATHDMRVRGDVGVRERLPPALLQSIPTDAFVPVAFVPGHSRTVRTRNQLPYFAIFFCDIKNYRGLY